MTVAISSLIAVATDSDTIVVTWTNNDAYTSIELEYNQDDGAWGFLEDIGGHLESRVVDDVTTNVKYGFRAKAKSRGRPWSSYSNVDYTTCHSSTVTETVTATDVLDDNYITGNLITETVTALDIVSDDVAYTDTLTETVTAADYILDAKSVSTNWGYYLTDSDGKILAYSEDYLNDDDTAITGRWESKQTDFSDQDPDTLDAMKAVYKVTLHYVDWTADTAISMAISTDGGVTWKENSKVLGNGDETTKTADFSFRIYGKNFIFKVENTSTDENFQFVQLDVFYERLGDYFNTSV